MANSLFDLTTNYFAIFGAKSSYQIDFKALKVSYLALQRQVHPDNFASESDLIQRQAVQRASYLNQAYDTLRSPLKRAVYLLQQAGHEYDPDVQIHNDPAFLMAQMELREQLAEVTEQPDPLIALEGFRQVASKNFSEHQKTFAEFFEDQDWNSAALEINKMMFASKLLTDIDQKEEALLD